MTLDPEEGHNELLASLQVAADRRNPGDIERIGQALRRAKTLHGASVAKVARLSRICQLLELQAGEMVFLEDAEVTFFQILIRGTVLESKSSEQGSHTVGSGMCLCGVRHCESYGENLLQQVRRSCTTVIF